MPYAIMISHAGEGKDRTWEHTDIVFDDGKQAGLYAKQENEYCSRYNPRVRYRAVKISADDPLLWREREQHKFDEGIYQKVPWADYFGSTGQYEHIDPDDPTKVRFIASQEDGLAGRYTSMSPGRFVQRFHGNVEFNLLDEWCAKMGLNETTSELKLARTPEEIIFVYNNGPHSCMAYKADHPVFEFVEQHPVAVYGDSDLAVAYIERYGEITARCLVWPEMKRYGRIYGDNKRLLERLKENDYVENWDFTGAWIRALSNEKNDLLIVPYLDGEMGVINTHTGWLVMTDEPHIICKEPNGIATTDRCERCDAQDIPLKAYRGVDGDEEPEYICMEGCSN